MDNCLPAFYRPVKTVTREITHQIRAGMISRLDARFERGKNVREKSQKITLSAEESEIKIYLLKGRLSVVNFH